FGTARLFVPALLFACLPAAHAVAVGLNLLRRSSGQPWAPAGVLVAVPALIVALDPGPVRAWAERLSEPRPLEIGLGEWRQGVVEAVRRHTTDQARILWEDERSGRLESHWSALLPVLTGRVFLGGIDPDAGIEHATSGLVDQALAGRPLREWGDAEL